MSNQSQNSQERLDAPAFIFDFGAVLFRWQPHVLIQQVLGPAISSSSSAKAAAAIFQGHAPEADWSLFDQGLISVPALVEKISARTGYDTGFLLRLVEAVPAHLTPVDETVLLLKDLYKTGARLFYLSNMPYPYARHLERSYEFMKLFTDGIFSCDVRLIKPSSAIFNFANERWQLDSSPIFIDDSKANVESAAAAGWGAIHFESAAQTRQSLLAMGLSF
jgi:putative hydrolase of the HAD superfamily